MQSTNHFAASRILVDMRNHQNTQMYLRLLLLVFNRALSEASNVRICWKIWLTTCKKTNIHTFTYTSKATSFFHRLFIPIVYGSYHYLKKCHVFFNAYKLHNWLVWKQFCLVIWACGDLSLSKSLALIWPEAITKMIEKKVLQNLTDTCHTKMLSALNFSIYPLGCKRHYWSCNSLIQEILG